MVLLDGKKVSDIQLSELKDDFLQLSYRGCLAVICICGDQSGEAYLKQIQSLAKQLSFSVKPIIITSTITTDELVSLIFSLNVDSSIDAILIQEPLPTNIDKSRVRQVILPSKDIDGFSSFHRAKLFDGYETILPCTCQAVLELLDHYEIDCTSKHVVIVNRSELLGRPLTYCFLKRDATVTVCHSATDNLAGITRTADILIIGVGKKDFITKDMVSEGVIIIDVGTTVIDGKSYGDVAFDEVFSLASYITPVPGGIGPMTKMILAENLYHIIVINS